MKCVHISRPAKKIEIKQLDILSNDLVSRHVLTFRYVLYVSEKLADSSLLTWVQLPHQSLIRVIVHEEPRIVLLSLTVYFLVQSKYLPKSAVEFYHKIKSVVLIFLACQRDRAYLVYLLRKVLLDLIL